MAFGDKFPDTPLTIAINNAAGNVGWCDKTPAQILEDVNYLLEQTKPKDFFPFEADPDVTLPNGTILDMKTVVVNNVLIDFVPMPVEMKVKITPPAVQCCEDCYNVCWSVEGNTFYCCKCRKPLTDEHVNVVLDRTARNAPGLAWMFKRK